MAIRIVKKSELCGDEAGECQGNQPAFADDALSEATDPCEVPTSTPADSCGSASSYVDSIGVDLQCDIDEARREGYHVTGLRPYRIFLTWRRRRRLNAPERSFEVIKRIELIPVNLVALDSTDLELTAVGLDAIGMVQLSEISPAQVSDDDLRGKLDGRDLVSSEEEFFYEIVHRPFPGQTNPPRRRYILASEPHHDGVGFQYLVSLKAQAQDLGDADEDQNLPGAFPRPRPELIS